MENIHLTFICRFDEGHPIIRAGEEYYVMPEKLQNLITDHMKSLKVDDVEEKMKNYFAHARVDQLRMALVLILDGILMEFTHLPFTFQATIFRREATDAVARFTLLHDTHQLGIIRREAPFKARHTTEEKRLWLMEYRQKILDEYKALTGEDPVKTEWNLNGIY